MSIVDDTVNQMKVDADIFHQVAQGGDAVTIPVEGGILKSLAKFFKDNQEKIDAIEPTMAGMQQTDQKDKANGYVGLSGYKLKILNAFGNVVSTIGSSATAVREYVLQDKSGTIAFTSDITGENSGKNTGDETKASILNKLDVTQLSGVNTGDQTLESLGAQAKLTYIPADAGTIGQPNGLTPLGPDAKVPAVYLPSFVDDVLEVEDVSDLPQPGERGKIYVIAATNTQFRWGGTSYIELVSSPGSSDSVGEGVNNLYFTQQRVLDTTLTGLLDTVAAIPIAASDKLLTALAKLQKQVTTNATAVALRAPLNNPTLTGEVRVPTATIGNTSDLAANTQFVSTTVDFAILNSVTNKMGFAGGITPLGSDGKVAAIYLPSFVDDVLEFANLAAFPTPGETGKIYVTLDTNLQYRWGGSAYIQLVPSPGSTDALAEGVGNLYFTRARVLATPLAGLDTSSKVAITAADTILSAFGKIQAQVSSIATGFVDKAAAFFTGPVAISAGGVKAAFSTISSLDLANDLVIFTANHAFVTGDYALYQTDSTAINAGGVTQKTAMFYVNVKAADRVTLHYNAVDAKADVNRVDLIANGTGVQTLAHAVSNIAMTVDTISSLATLETVSHRFALGNTWQSVSTRIQSRVGQTLAALIEFNPKGNLGGLRFYTTNPGKFEFIVDSTTPQLVVDQAGVRATSSLTYNGVEVATINQLTYDISGGLAGKPLSTDAGLIHLAIRGFNILQGTSTGRAFAAVAPTAAYTLSIRKNGTQFGTVAFAANANVGTVTISTDTSFVAGDRIALVAPAPVEANISDILVTFKGTSAV